MQDNKYMQLKVHERRWPLTVLAFNFNLIISYAFLKMNVCLLTMVNDFCLNENVLDDGDFIIRISLCFDFSK